MIGWSSGSDRKKQVPVNIPSSSKTVGAEHRQQPFTGNGDVSIVRAKYCKRFTFSVYDIWRNFNFLLFGVDLIWWLIEIHLLDLYTYTFSAVYLIWHRDATAKGAKKNTPSNKQAFTVFSGGR